MTQGLRLVVLADTHVPRRAKDLPQLRRRLPEVAEVQLEGMRWGVVHETGARTGREQRMRAAYPGGASRTAPT